MVVVQLAHVLLDACELLSICDAMVGKLSDGAQAQSCSGSASRKKKQVRFDLPSEELTVEERARMSRLQRLAQLSIASRVRFAHICLEAEMCNCAWCLLQSATVLANQKQGKCYL